MRTPHFLSLAQLDDQHFVAACRHGVVHLTWERVTVRFGRDEFRRLADLLERAAAARPPASLREGNLRITSRLDEDCELQMESLILLLPAAQFREFAGVARQAVDRLDEILASGMWDKEEPEEPPSSPIEQIRRTPFSRN